MKEARYWEKMEKDGMVHCMLCPHHCRIKPGKQGICKNKLNEGGTLYALHYGEITALAMDPVEKKPLYHFYPGRRILSVGTIGCNFACDFCQNWHLWNGEVHSDRATPEEIVAAAQTQKSFAIAYTYNEPYMSFEFVMDTARLARKAGLKNVMVTNGYYNPEPLDEMLPEIDAMNIDLKSIRDEFYKKLCKGRVDPVKATIERAFKDCLVELTNLVITGENDSGEDLQALVDWVASISPDIPLHFSAYHPTYKLKNPATKIDRLMRAYEMAREKLNYVYLGNVMTKAGQDSVCPHCAATLVQRHGYHSDILNLAGNKCALCGHEIYFKNE